MTIRLTADVDGRRLRLAVEGSPHQFVVDPLPAKRGRALASAYLEATARDEDASALSDLFAEALGAGNFALISGDLVQEFDPLGNYLRTWLPGAVMVEPEGDVSAARTGERVRIIPSPWDGLELRAEEVEALALAALSWQSPGGCAALDAVLDGQAGAAALTTSRR